MIIARFVRYFNELLGMAAPAQLGTGTADATVFLRGDSTWAVGVAGPPGPQGPPGTSGGANPYKWNTNTAASDPTSGELKINNVTATAATFVYASSVDQNGVVVMNLAAIQPGDEVLIYVSASLTNFIRYTVTGAIVNHTNTWIEIPVAYKTLGTGGFAPGNNAAVRLQIDLATTQTITLTGNVTGSGTTSIATTIAAGAVTNAMLAGGITASNLVGTDITTVGTITTGTWQGTPIAAAKLGPPGAGVNTYTNATVTIDGQGRIATASSGGIGQPISGAAANEVLYADGSANLAQSANFTFVLNASSGTLKILSGNNANYAYAVVGRTAEEIQFGVAAAAAQFFPDSAANDGILKNASGNPIRIGASSAQSSVLISPNSMTLLYNGPLIFSPDGTTASGDTQLSRANPGVLNVGNPASGSGGTIAATAVLINLSSDQNDWNPGPAMMTILNASVPVKISGIVKGADGQILYLQNQGSNPITFLSFSNLSASANGFWTGMGMDIIMAPGDMIFCMYTKWFNCWAIRQLSCLSQMALTTTANRPTGAPQARQYYDTTINKPIWWDGAGNWRDGSGNIV
jgi:hypothetical protein